MRASVFFLAAGLSWASDLQSFSRAANAVQLHFDDGFGEILWLNSSAVRIRQTWRDQRPASVDQPLDRVVFSVLDEPDQMTMRSRELVVRVSKRPFAVSFEELDGSVILDQLPFTSTTDGIRYRFREHGEGRLHGLGGLDGPLDRRGTAVQTDNPLLMSSEGFGLFFRGSPRFQFDLAAATPEEIVVDAIKATRADYAIYRGGAPSEILGQHADHFGVPIEASRSHISVLTPLEKPAYAPLIEGTWQQILHGIYQSGFAGIPVVAVNPALVQGIRTAGGDLLAALMPILLAPEGFELSAPAMELRQQFLPHRLTYLMEARDRGLPMIHAMPYQFPADPQAASIEDQFFFGDEILVAPFLNEKSQRSVYLPQGIWTDWWTNKMIRGRTSIAISTTKPNLPMWVRNGSIVPVERAGLIEFHYFPKLGAEYFLWEPEIDEITQAHAAPAAGELRLEIEERVGRRYEWVVHNVDRPLRVAHGDLDLRMSNAIDLPPGSWRYDEIRRNLHVRVETKAGDDLILIARFRTETWFRP